MVLPDNTEHRQEILRRLLVGSQIVFPVMVWANCGGDIADFNDDQTRLAFCAELEALGYRSQPLVGRIPTCGHTMFVYKREEEWPGDIIGPMPYFGPLLEVDDDHPEDELPRSRSEVIADFKRYLEETYPNEEDW